jgi:phosphatidylinositol alpha-1,6-mannosyltransferase
VVTAEAPQASVVPFPSLDIHRTRFEAGLGLLSPALASAHIRIARQVRMLAGDDAVVHCGRALTEGTIALLAGFGAGLPYVCWTHGEELPIVASSRELTWIMRRVHRRAAALLANSRNTASLLTALGNPPERVHVVHPGVDPTRFRPDADSYDLRQRVGRGADLVLLSVGRLQARKGHDLVIRALPAIATSLTLRYVIAGEGPEKDRLSALAADLGLSDRVEFLGKISPEALPGLYAASDIFVHPNRVEGGDFEGFGIVFLEAAATGLPAIGGRSGGVPEAIEDGVTGMLVGGQDAEELQRAILSLALSRPLRERLGAAARDRVLREFTWDRAARQVHEIDIAIRKSRGAPMR